jgi:outer membrane protein OmpA-like peptidoglycan-associated protein
MSIDNLTISLFYVRYVSVVFTKKIFEKWIQKQPKTTNERKSMKNKQLAFIALIAGLAAIPVQPVQAAKYINAPPLAQVIKTPVGPVREGGAVQLPIITWGGDIATILANGDSLNTAPGSIFAQQGLSFTLKRQDDFPTQVGGFIGGESPYMRCTVGMLDQAVEVLQDPRVKPIVVGQLTYSTGGDVLVVKPNIRKLSDLKGKTIVLQAYGPHVDFLTTVLENAGVSLKDVTVKYVKDLTGTEETPAAAFRSDPDVAAAFMISPDAADLTSGGVGTGSEKSVKGAWAIFSTKTANRIIVDVYAVRSDYFQAHQADVEKFEHALLIAQEHLATIVQDSGQKAAYDKLMVSSATILLDSAQAVADARGLYDTCEYVGFVGNVKTFSDQTYQRRFSVLQDEIQTGLIGLGLISSKVAVATAGFDYEALKQGLTHTVPSTAPVFQANEVAKVIAQRSEQGTLGDSSLFSFEVFFKVNQATFAPELYAQQFDEVIKRAAIYAGAVITVEGHSDPTHYVDQKLANQPAIILAKTKQSALNTSLNRAVQVREAIIAYAKSKGIVLDPSQFTTMGHGISNPKTGIGSDGEPKRPDSQAAADSNMRCELRIVNVESESVWTPAGGGQ